MPSLEANESEVSDEIRVERLNRALDTLKSAYEHGNNVFMDFPSEVPGEEPLHVVIGNDAIPLFIDDFEKELEKCQKDP